MKCMFLILFVCLTFSGISQLEGKKFSDLCVGCCGMELTFGNGYFEGYYDGYSRNFEPNVGEWYLIGDTLFIEHDTLEIHKYLRLDSMTFQRITSSRKLYLIDAWDEHGNHIHYEYQMKFRKVFFRNRWKWQLGQILMNGEPRSSGD